MSSYNVVKSHWIDGLGSTSMSFKQCIKLYLKIITQTLFKNKYHKSNSFIMNFLNYNFKNWMHVMWIRLEKHEL